MLILKIGHKHIKQYISAALVYWRTNKDKSVKVCARGRLISKAVDVAEILKRFNVPKLEVESIDINTEELVVAHIISNKEYLIGEKVNNVSTIEILLKGVDINGRI